MILNVVRTPSAVLTAVLTASLVLLLAAACGDRGAAPAASAEPTRLESPEVGIAVVVPPGASFTAAGTEGGVLRLTSEGETTGDDLDLGPATLVYAAEPTQVAGVNLVAAVNERQQELEALPGGEFYGQVELGGPLGTAYSTRGRFVDADGEPVEEVRIFAVHPQGDRLLHLTLSYPPVAGQAPARVEQALTAFGWIEPLPAPAAPPLEAGTSLAQPVPAPAESP